MLYDEDFHLYNNYEKVHWTDINTYEFKELKLINQSIVLDYFDDFRFFQNLEYMDNAQEVIWKSKNKYNIVICSIGRKLNIKYKGIWIKNHLPYCDFIGLKLEEDGKQSVDMSDGILIDDNMKMLESSNAKTKIIFGDEYSWNADNPNGYHRCYNWTEVEKLLLV